MGCMFVIRVMMLQPTKHDESKRVWKWFAGFTVSDHSQQVRTVLDAKRPKVLNEYQCANVAIQLKQLGEYPIIEVLDLKPCKLEDFISE